MATYGTSARTGNSRKSFGNREAKIKSANYAMNHESKAQSPSLQVAAEFIAFVGVMIAMLGLTFWPNDPRNIDGLKETIYFPASVASEFKFTSPLMEIVRTHPDTLPMQLEDLGIPLLLLFGLVAILGRQWVLTGLFFAVLVFPWSYFGLHLPFWNVFVAIFGLILLVRVVPLPWLLRLAIIPIIILFNKPILGTLSGWAYSIASGVETLVGREDAQWHDYRMISNVDFTSDSFKLPNGPRILFKRSNHTKTLMGVLRDPKDKAGYAYARAQELALKGKLQSAVRLLSHAEEFGLQKSPYTQQRFDLIRTHAKAMGVYGREKQQEVMSNYKKQALTLSLAVGSGVLLGGIGLWIGLRKLKSQQNKGKSTELNPNRADAGKEGRRFFGVSASILALSAGATAFVSDQFWLPDAGSNTAFHKVSVSMLALIETIQSGYAVDLKQNVNYLPDWPFSWIILAILAVLMIALRPYTRHFMFAVVAQVIYMASQPILPIHNAPREIPPISISMEVRAGLEKRFKAPLKVMPRQKSDASGGDRNAIPTFAEIGKMKVPTAHEQRQRAALKRFNKNRVWIEQKLDATYELAQIAYLEDNPKDAAQKLTFLIKNGMPEALVHRQRIAIMIDWVEARGYEMPAHPTKPVFQPLTDLPRWISRILMGVSILFGLAALLSMGLARQTSKPE